MMRRSQTNKAITMIKHNKNNLKKYREIPEREENSEHGHQQQKKSENKRKTTSTTRKTPRNRKLFLLSPPRWRFPGEKGHSWKLQEPLKTKNKWPAQPKPSKTEKHKVNKRAKGWVRWASLVTTSS